MKNKLIARVEAEQIRATPLPRLNIGDSVRVHVKIKEGDKERIQIFPGTIIAQDGEGATETFTVRRVSFGEGVERVFPLHAPSVDKVEIEGHGRSRRAKLYYLRRREGKATRLERTED